MNIQIKKRLLSYLESHNDGSEEAESLIKTMKHQTCFAETDSYSIDCDDLESYWDQESLRKKLNKADGEEYTVEDCQRIADAITETIADEFSEDLENAIAY